MLGAMILSIIFLVVDVCSVTNAITYNGLPTGINPFWKLSFVFKCLTDSVVLDDFKTALDRLHNFKNSRLPTFVTDDPDARDKAATQYERAWNTLADRRGSNNNQRADIPSPDGELIHPSVREDKMRASHKEYHHELGHLKDGERRLSAASDDSGFPTVVRPAVHRGSYGQVTTRANQQQQQQQQQDGYFPPQKRRSEVAVMQDEYAMAMKDIGGDSKRYSSKSEGKRKSDGSPGRNDSAV